MTSCKNRGVDVKVATRDLKDVDVTDNSTVNRQKKNDIEDNFYTQSQVESATF